MNLVVDASVAMKWLVDETDHDLARGLLLQFDYLRAPDFVLIETANVLWKKVRRSEITLEQALAGFEALPRLFGHLSPSSGLLGKALQFAIDMDHPVYDCLYLACAENVDGALVTADQKFAAKVRDSSSPVHVFSLSEAANTEF